MTDQHQSPHPTAKDLSQEDPAPMDVKLAGYPWLPRMIDKARASHAGTLGDYYRYPCPIDAVCLDLLGINAAAFREIATRALDAQDILDHLSRLGANTQRLIRFDPVQVNAELHRDGS
jgi:hypothetical protein